MTITITARDFNQLEHLLRESTIDRVVVEQAILQLPRLVYEHIRQPVNRDVNGVKHLVVVEVRRTMKILEFVIRKSANDVASRVESTKWMRFIASCDRFAEISARTNTYCRVYQITMNSIDEQLTAVQANEMSSRIHDPLPKRQDSSRTPASQERAG